MIKYCIFLCLGIVFIATPLLADESLPDDLTELSLEALMSIEVTIHGGSIPLLEIIQLLPGIVFILRSSEGEDLRQYLHEECWD